MQRWKFFKRNGTFVHVGGTPPFEVKIETPALARPTNLPRRPFVVSAGVEPEAEGDDSSAEPGSVSDAPEPGAENPFGVPDFVPDAPELGAENPSGVPDFIPDAPEPGVENPSGEPDSLPDGSDSEGQDFVEDRCKYSAFYPPPRSKPFELPEPEIVPSEAGNPGYLPHISVYSNTSSMKPSSVDVQSDRAFVDVERAYLLMRLDADSEASVAIQRDVEFADSRYVPETIDIYHTNVNTVGAAMPARTLGHYSFSFRVSFANFFEEKLVPKSTYTLSEYLADLLNMLGIFLGVSVLACLLVPASMYLVRKGVSKK